jgi:RNA polymerase sigma-70 factor (ECF subfamily)
MYWMGVDDEAELVARLRSGDAEAFDAIYDEYRPRIFGFLLRLSRRRTVAEDLLDETFLRLVRHAPALRTDTNLGAWLFTVARNLYWSYRRASALEDDVEPATLSLWPITAPGPTPFDLAAGSELETRLEQALRALPPQHREVLLLVIREGMKPSEAAEVCGVTAEALRQRLARARAALIRHMNLERPARRYGT